MRYNPPRIYRHAEGLEVILPQGIYRRICQNVAAHYPNECGGVLAGKIQGHQAIITRMFLPDRVQSSRVRFRRLADHINVALERLHNQTGGVQLYLGEWHSHPDALPIPSGMDLAAMSRIQASSSVRIQTPLLLIMGYHPEHLMERFYLFTNQKFEHYEFV